MANKNTINKPSRKINKAHHAGVIGKKRSLRAKRAAPTRSNSGRYNTDTAPRPTDSRAVALYNGGFAKKGGVTTNTLSKKRAQKIERNKRYVAKRNELLNIDLQAKQEEMEVDTEPRKRNQKEKTQLQKIKLALWAVVEDSTGSAMGLNVLGEGTTIGIQAF